MSTVKVVYNKTYGGFGLSDVGLNLYNEKRLALKLDTVKYDFTIKRTDPLLIEVIEELGKNANGVCAKLAIDTIPIEYEDCYVVDEYDGKENIYCKPQDLVKHKFKDLKVDDLDLNKCRDILKEIINILNS